MNGVEAAEEMRRLLGPSTPPIVGCSADVMDETAAAFAAAGVRAIVAKPFDMRQIVRVVLTQC
jgi:CheY-like chemotaxis protein